jgi:hypothetical protein
LDHERPASERIHRGDESWTFPDDDAGRDDLRILAEHYIASNPLRLTKVVAMRAPWMTGAELSDFLADVGRFPRLWIGSDLAAEFTLKEAGRIELGVRTVRPLDVTPAQRKAQRKVREKERKRAVRRTKGAKPHDESKARTKPWETAGVSRATWYRQQAKNRETDSGAMNLVKTADESVSPSKRKRRPCRAGECPGEALRIPLPAAAVVQSGPPSEPDMSNLVSIQQRKSQISESCRAEPVSPPSRFDLQPEKKAA